MPQFNWEVNFGNVLTVVLMMVSAFAYLQRKFASLEEVKIRMESLEKAFLEVRGAVATLRDGVHELDKRVAVIETRLSAAAEIVTRRKRGEG